MRLLNEKLQLTAPVIISAINLKDCKCPDTSGCECGTEMVYQKDPCEEMCSHEPPQEIDDCMVSTNEYHPSQSKRPYVEINTCIIKRSLSSDYQCQRNTFMLNQHIVQYIFSRHAVQAAVDKMLIAVLALLTQIRLGAHHTMKPKEIRELHS